MVQALMPRCRCVVTGSLVAAAVLWLAGVSAANGQVAETAVYGFAQQKVYGMTLSATPGSSATVSGSDFSVRMTTQATVDSVPGVVAHIGGLDALQSFITSGLPVASPENYSGNANLGMAVPANERVLLQTNPTAVGVAQGVDLTTPPASDFFAGHNFARGDGYVTPSPDTTFGPPGSGTVPPDVPPGSWPSNGNQIPAGHLFAPIGTADTLSIDLVAESVLNGEAFATIASGGSDWVVTGGFSVIGGSTDRAAVSLDFNIVERMVVYSWDPANDAATASNTFAFDVLDSSGQSVFGPAAGANPSITRLLSSELLGAETYNNNTLVPTHVYPGPVVVNFQTMPLPPGDYSFTMKAATTAYVTALPEPAVSTAAAGLALAAVCRFGSRRRTVRPSGP